MDRFFALSRTTHAILDLAAPAFCALLWLGHFPPWPTILLSILTAFAAYTAVYALNDVLGIECDLKKFDGGRISRGYSVEASSLRHPLAQGLLSVRSGMLWMVGWFAVALLGSYALNPAIAVVLVVATALEASYCRLQNVTPLRTLVSGLVKVSGPLAAILVVDRQPSPMLLLVVLGWLFFWEIGGQNIPSDWNYTQQDQSANATSIPIRLGLDVAGKLVLLALCLSVAASLLLPLVSPAPLGLPYLLVSVLLGYFLLLRPGYFLLRSKAGALAARLFDRASYYPFSHLILLSLFLALDRLSH